MDVRGCWITVNRSCNLRCKWCYAKSSEYDLDNSMDFTLFKKLVDIATDLKVKNFLLIGGEPTIHPDFFQFLRYLKNNNLKHIFVSNGVKFASRNFCLKVQKYGGDVSVDISLKGISSSDYKENTGHDNFCEVIQAIKNLRELEIKHSISYVITAENVASISLFFKRLRDAGITEHVNLAFCNPALNLDGAFENSFVNNTQVELANSFSKEYKKIETENYSLRDSAPLCLQNEDFIQDMLPAGKIATSCHVHTRRGLIFDTKGELLLCNSLVGFNIGKFGIDYNDAQSLEKFWDSPYVVSLYQKLSNLPSSDCLNCDKKQYCAGGCCIQYFNNSFDDLKKIYAKYREV